MKKTISISTSLREVKNNKFSYLFMFFQLVCFSSLVRQFQTDSFLVINFILSFIIFYFKGKKFEIIFFKTIFILFILFIIPIIFWQQANTRQYIGFIIRVINGYLILRIFEDKFISIFVNLVFFLSLISIPLYVIQLISPGIYNIFTNFSRLTLNQERFEAGHKYLLVFLFNAWGRYRNSGFMWEPASFGAMLAWGVMFDLLYNKMKLNFKSKTMLVTMLTTFSIGTFSYIVLITLFLISANFKKSYQLLIPGLLIIGLFMYTPLLNEMKQMMMGKLIVNQDQAEEIAVYENEGDRKTRTTGIILSVQYLLENPLGLGFMESEEYRQLSNSASGFSQILFRWGIIGISIFLYLIYLLPKYLSPFLKLNLVSRFIAMICFVLTFMGNPFYNQPFVFSLLILPIILKLRYRQSSLHNLV